MSVKTFSDRSARLFLAISVWLTLSLASVHVVHAVHLCSESHDHGKVYPCCWLVYHGSADTADGPVISSLQDFIPLHLLEDQTTSVAVLCKVTCRGPPLA